MNLKLPSSAKANEFSWPPPVPMLTPEQIMPTLPPHPGGDWWKHAEEKRPMPCARKRSALGANDLAGEGRHVTANI